jgi:hypothetical protein
MAKTLTVPRILNYPPAMNYQLLRREGLRHLERLGSSIWTDFNSHDPGVTILEVLCYALTDLGYRTQLPETDLFAPGGDYKSFFTASEILPNAPVTAFDFRKILIDIDGVRNAWIKENSKADVLVQFDFSVKVNALEIPGLERYVGEFSNDDPAMPVLKFNAGAENPWGSILAMVQAKAGLCEMKQLLEKGSLAEIPAKAAEVIAALGDVKTSVKAKTDVAATALGQIIVLTSKAAIEAIVEQAFAQLDFQLAMSDFFDGSLSDDSKPSANKLKALVLFLIENRYPDIESWVRTKFEAGYQNAPAGDLSFLEIIRLLRRQIQDYWASPAAERAGKTPAWDKLEAFLIAKPGFLEAVVYPYLTAYLLKNSLTTAKKEDVKHKLFIPGGLYKIYLQLEEGYQSQGDRIRKTVLARLHENRALCEDFNPDIKVIDTVELGIETTIEVSPGADLVQVYADMRYAIENFLSPSVKMYGLQEMMDKYATFVLTNESFEQLVEADLPSEILADLEPLRGRPFIGLSHWRAEVARALGTAAMPDYEGILLNATGKTYDSNRVFDGPGLTHGFIDDAELAAADWRRTVYRSDLFQVISRVENVVRVQKLVIRKCGDEVGNQDWCLKFDCDCQPTVDWKSKCSLVRFTKGGRPVAINDSLEWEVQDRLEQLRTQNAKIDRTGHMDLPIPAGNPRDDLADYTSIQEEFPRTYHIGREGLVSTETSLRKAQVKQLKGFLMFFDQLLVNYLAQLAQVREALSVEKPKVKMALYQTLYEVPFVKTLFTGLAPDADWETFRDNPRNPYVQSLDKLANGSEVTSRLRQNQVLDHLLARFGEQFTDYAFELFNIQNPVEESSGGDAGVQDWLKDRRRFLRHLPSLGSLRGRGFNYLPEPEDDNLHFWDSDNIEGFKRRVLAQLGVKDWSRKTVSVLPRFVMDTRLEMVGKSRRYRFGIKPEEDSPTFWLRSTALFSQLDPARNEGERFLSQSADTDRYAVVQDDNHTFFYAGFWEQEAGDESGGFTPSVDDAVMLSEPFESEEEATQFLKKVVDFVDDQCSSDNFHVIEHILLRPLDKDYLVLRPMSLPANFNGLDAYSFQVTIVVPDWVDRFRIPAQYAHFEQLVRMEMPVHVMPRFVKLDRMKMIDFEETYYGWLNVKTDPSVETFDLRKAANALIELLNGY